MEGEDLLLCSALALPHHTDVLFTLSRAMAPQHTEIFEEPPDLSPMDAITSETQQTDEEQN